jgi:serine protease DegQ
MRVHVSRLGRTSVTLCVIPLTSAGSVIAQTPDRPLFQNEDGLPTLAPLLAEVTPAVVNISVESHQTSEMNPLFNDPFFRRFFEMPPMPQQPMQRQQMPRPLTRCSTRRFRCKRRQRQNPDKFLSCINPVLPSDSD